MVGRSLTFTYDIVPFSDIGMKSAAGGGAAAISTLEGRDKTATPPPGVA